MTHPVPDFDANPPVPVAEYRRSQAVLPGVEALYRLVRAILDTELADGARVLVVGAGGGREVEALAASPRGFRITGVDPSADMLAIAADYAQAPGVAERVQLLRGTIDVLADDDRFDAATSVLVSHFLPDDGAKARQLARVRARLPTGAPYLHVDASVEDRAMAARLARVMRTHALLVGFDEQIAGKPGDMLAAMLDIEGPPLIVGEARTRELMANAGFADITPFFRGLWFTGWWAEAA